MPSTSLGPRCAAEFIGTFWLVLGGCGSAVIAGRFPYEATPMEDANFFGLGFLGVALAFGLTVVTGAYALGHVSGGHFNPAVSVGLWVGQRIPPTDLLPYVVAQVLGATLGDDPDVARQAFRQAAADLAGRAPGRPDRREPRNWEQPPGVSPRHATDRPVAATEPKDGTDRGDGV